MQGTEQNCRYPNYLMTTSYREAQDLLEAVGWENGRKMGQAGGPEASGSIFDNYMT